jgi:hypothetical protein
MVDVVTIQQKRPKMGNKFWLRSAVSFAVPSFIVNK